METNLSANDPQGAVRFFEDKVRYSTGPVELEHALAHGRRIGTDFNLIDVRGPAEFAKGHIPGAENLPEGYWSTLAGLGHDRLNIIYGESPVSHVAARAALEFATAGFSVMELDGGFLAWEEHGFQIERESSKTKDSGRLRSESSNEPNEGRFLNESIL